MFLSALISLFSVVNPLGAIPVFLAMTPDYTAGERARTAFHTMLYFIAILLAFFLGGSLILNFFGLSLNALRIAGGLVIMSSGYALLQGKFAQSRAINDKVRAEAAEKEDISFTPLCMPLLSGPGSISLLIGMYSEFPAWMERLQIVGVIVAMGVIVFLILRGAPSLFKVLGVAGLKAISRIMGFLVMAIGIQYIITGGVNLVNQLNAL